MNDRLETRIVPDRAALASVAAWELARICRESAGDRITIAFAGGSTPKGLYRELARGGTPPWRDEIPWERTLWLPGDERLVPADHPDSNLRMARETLLAHVPVPERNVIGVPTGTGAGDAVAARFEEALRAAFGLTAGQRPRLDLVLLGMGSDGHTASLFPGSPALEERERLAVAVGIDGVAHERITLTYPVIDNAENVIFLVAGRDKAKTVRRVFDSLARGGGADDRGTLPAARVRPSSGRLLWLLDEEAASAMDRAR